MFWCFSIFLSPLSRRKISWLPLAKNNHLTCSWSWSASSSESQLILFGKETALAAWEARPGGGRDQQDQQDQQQDQQDQQRQEEDQHHKRKDQQHLQKMINNTMLSLYEDQHSFLCWPLVRNNWLPRCKSQKRSQDLSFRIQRTNDQGDEWWK